MNPQNETPPQTIIDSASGVVNDLPYDLPEPIQDVLNGLIVGAMMEHLTTALADKEALATRLAEAEKALSRLQSVCGEKDKAITKALRLNFAWDTASILAKLQSAVKHLLHDHDCDAHGHEEFASALGWSREIDLTQLQAALSSGETTEEKND